MYPLPTPLLLSLTTNGNILQSYYPDTIGKSRCPRLSSQLSLMLLFQTHLFPSCLHPPLRFWKVKLFIAQLCLTLCHPMDCSPPGSFIHGILQARILEWVAIHFSRVFSWAKDWAWVSCTTGRFFTVWATRQAHLSLHFIFKFMIHFELIFV